MTDEEIIQILKGRGKTGLFHETPDCIVILKGAGISSAPLKDGEQSAFDLFASQYPEIREVRGRSEREGGLIHRIDRETGGLLLVARTQRFYDAVIEAQGSGRFLKQYTAYCTNGPVAPGAPTLKEDELPTVIESRFRSFGEKGAQVRPVFEGCAGRADLKKAGNTRYETVVREMSMFGSGYRVCCQLDAGFRHQVRSHLSSAGFPVIGDVLYGTERPAGSGCDCGGMMLFFASGLTVPDEGIALSIPVRCMDQIAASICLTSLTR